MEELAPLILRGHSGDTRRQIWLRSAVVAKEPPLEGGGPLAWRIGIMDRGASFGWSQLNDAAKLREIISKLHEFEHKPWAEITKGGSHATECSRLCKEPKDRLKEISQDDVEDWMSFGLQERTGFGASVI